MSHMVQAAWYVPKRILVILVFLLAFVPQPARAQVPPNEPNDSTELRKAAEARFKRSLELMKQGLYGPALAEAQEAHRLQPSTWTPLLIIARALKFLGRFDESLDTYAQLVREHEQKLKEDKPNRAPNYKLVLSEIDELRKLVGTLEIEGSEPGATIVVDSQTRGTYPLLDRVRVSSGSHIVRVFKQGHEAFETRIEIPGGTRKVVKATLPKLLATGTLRIVETQGRELSVIVDGVPIGQTPLTLPFAPGKHSVVLRGEGNLGTAPATVQVRVDELSELRIEAEVLTATLKVVPVPFDALVSIDSVLIGRGAWDGRVRAGGHVIEVAADGFLPEKRKIIILNDKRAVIEVPLERDPKSPFWRKPPPPPHFTADISTGFMLSPSFGGEVERLCTGQCQVGLAHGSYLAIRGGYELSSRVSFGLVAGSMSAFQSIHGRATDLNVIGLGRAAGHTDHALSLRSLLVGGWMGYGFESKLPVRLRLSAGGMFGVARDERAGRFTPQRTNAGVTSYPVGTVGEEQSGRFVFVAPEIRVGLPLTRKVELFFGIEMPILFAVDRPTWSASHGVFAGPDGYGSFDAEPFISSPLIAFVPSAGGRFDL